MITIDPEFKNLIPPLTPEEYEGLKNSLLNDGCRDAIVTWNNTIIDGHNRYEICTREDIPFQTKEMSFSSRDDVKIWIIENQFSRRNISIAQRCNLAFLLEPLISKKAKENLSLSQGRGVKGCQISDNLINTNKELAKIAGVSHDTIHKARKIRDKANPEIKKKVESGEISINEAYKEVRADEKKEQKKIAIEEINKLTTPTGKYHILVVDPPWQYEKRSEDITHRGRCTYPTMDIEEIKQIDIPCEENAILWLWTTNAFLHDAYHIVDAWGFTPKTILTWVKDRMGVGDWLRGQTEHCILAVKGKPIIDLTNQTTVLNAPLREHSRKPDEFYNLVSTMCPGRKIDIFSREAREGWDQWGCEVDRF